MHTTGTCAHVHLISSTVSDDRLLVMVDRVKTCNEINNWFRECLGRVHWWARILFLLLECQPPTLSLQTTEGQGRHPRLETGSHAPVVGAPVLDGFLDIAAAEFLVQHSLRQSG